MQAEPECCGHISLDIPTAKIRRFDLMNKNGKNKMTELYRTLSRLKKVNPALYKGIKGGDLVRLDENLDGKVIAFMREADDSYVLACFNLSGEEKTIELQLGNYSGVYTEAFSGETEQFEDRIKLTLSPYGNAIYSKK